MRARLPRTPRPASKTSSSSSSSAGGTDEATREQAVRIYAEQGLAEAHRVTGCPKSSIRRWAKAAGIDAAESTSAALAATTAATEASVAVRRERAAAARATLVDLQAQIAMDASRMELKVLQALAAVANDPALRRAHDPKTGETIPASLRQLQALLSGPRLSEIVGARTRAIHDLQLLDGQATEQPEGGLTVRFATPAPLAITSHGETPTGPDLSIVELPTADHRESA